MGPHSPLYISDGLKHVRPFQNAASVTANRKEEAGIGCAKLDCLAKTSHADHFINQCHHLISIFYVKMKLFYLCDVWCSCLSLCFFSHFQDPVSESGTSTGCL